MKYVLKTQYGEQFVCSGDGINAWFETENKESTLIAWEHDIKHLREFAKHVHNVNMVGWTIWELSDDLMTVGKRLE